MATKTLSPSAQTSNRRRTESGASKLRKLIAKQQALTKQLRDLMEELEDAEDGRRLEAAIKENQGRPLIPWEEAKKKLGLKFA
jgi:hypothetical protein